MTLGRAPHLILPDVINGKESVYENENCYLVLEVCVETIIDGFR